MPIIEKESTEQELRDQIARLDYLIGRNPATAKDMIFRKFAVQRELNNLLLSKDGYEVVKTADIETRVIESYVAGYAAAKAEKEQAQ